ncbi:nucleic acid-binding, OB-fold protein [Tanacetum coccineum]
MWGDMAREFDKGLVETIEVPVIIVVSSYLQLSASPATHYYLNSEIPETKRSRAKLRAWYYTSCGECTRKARDNSVWECVDSGPQPEPTYSLRAFVSNETATTLLTSFTSSADAIIEHGFSELVWKLDTPDPQ